MGNIDLRKQNKRNLILDLIRTGPRASRASLREASGLAMKTVLQCVEGLLEENLILESGKSGPSVGRRATYLDINPAGCYWIGVKFTAQRITCVTMDFSGAVLETDRETLLPGLDARQILDHICQCVEESARRLRAAGKRLGGVGVGAPGMVNREKGLIRRFVQIPGWENIPLSQVLEKVAGCPVYLEQSVRTTALALLMEPENLAVENLLYVLVRSGVGMAVLLGRESLGGYTGIAGEIGHVRVPGAGAMCSCGKRGCLESEICYSALARRMREGLAAGAFPGLRAEDASARALMDGVGRGDKDALRLWEEAVAQLCQTLAPVIAAVNPEKVIFSGEMMGGPDFPARVMAHFQGMCPEGACDGLSLVTAPFDERYDAIGAACLPMYQEYGIWGASRVPARKEEMQL